MRIAEQGYISVQPTYQHVGYTSAYVRDHFMATRVDGAACAALGTAVMLLATALIYARRHRGSVLPTVGACALSVVSLVTIAGSLYVARPQTTLAPGFAETFRNIETASALTEEWVAELGRVPTGEEWAARMEGRACALDAWGISLRYRVRDQADSRDGQNYQIVGGMLRPDVTEMHAFDFGLSSTAFGPDGLFGTADDTGRLHGQHGDWQKPGGFEHGRAPRQPGVVYGAGEAASK